MVFFNLIKLTFLRVYPSLKPHMFLYGKHLPIWYGFSDVIHIKVNNGLKLAIFNLFELTFSMSYSSMKQHIFVLHSQVIIDGGMIVVTRLYITMT